MQELRGTRPSSPAYQGLGLGIVESLTARGAEVTAVAAMRRVLRGSRCGRHDPVGDAADPSSSTGRSPKCGRRS